MSISKEKRMQIFEIKGRLPGYNELHKQPWQVARRIKQDAMSKVIWAAWRYRVKPVQGPCEITIACYEPNARRDVDNVKSGANKVILDALQQMGVLQGDGRKYVTNVINPPVEVDRENFRVVVTIAQPEDANT